MSLQNRMGPFTSSTLVTRRILKTLSTTFSKIKYMSILSFVQGSLAAIELLTVIIRTL